MDLNVHPGSMLVTCGASTELLFLYVAQKVPLVLSDQERPYMNYFWGSSRTRSQAVCTHNHHHICPQLLGSCFLSCSIQTFHPT